MPRPLPGRPLSSANNDSTLSSSSRRDRFRNLDARHTYFRRASEMDVDGGGGSSMESAGGSGGGGAPAASSLESRTARTHGGAPPSIFSVAEVADGGSSQDTAAALTQPIGASQLFDASGEGSSTRTATLEDRIASSGRTSLDIEAYLSARRSRHGGRGEGSSGSRNNSSNGDDGGPSSGSNLFNTLADMDNPATRRHGRYIDLGEALDSVRPVSGAGSGSGSSGPATRRYQQIPLNTGQPSDSTSGGGGPSDSASPLIASRTIPRSLTLTRPLPSASSTTAIDSLRARINRQEAQFRAREAAFREREAAFQARMRHLEQAQRELDGHLTTMEDTRTNLDIELTTSMTEDVSSAARDALDRLSRRLTERDQERLQDGEEGDQTRHIYPDSRDFIIADDLGWVPRRERNSILPPLPEGSSADAVDIELQHGEGPATTSAIRPSISLPINSDIVRLRTRATRGTGAGTGTGTGNSNSNSDADARPADRYRWADDDPAYSRFGSTLNADGTGAGAGAGDYIDVWQPSYMGPAGGAASGSMEIVDILGTSDEDEDEEGEEDQSMDDDDEEDASDSDADRGWAEPRLDADGYRTFDSENANPPSAGDNFAGWIASTDANSPEGARLGRLARAFVEYARLGGSSAQGGSSRPIAASASTTRARTASAHAPTNGNSARRYEPAVVAGGDRPRSTPVESGPARRRDRSIATMPSASSLSRRKSMKRRRVDSEMSHHSLDFSYSFEDPLPAHALPNYLRTSTHLPIHYLPSMFNEHDKSERLALTTGRGKDGSRQSRTVVTFIGTGERGDADAAAVRTDSPIPSSAGVYYYEVEILDKGLEGYISVGFMMRWSNLSRLVGWDPGSFGWHMDDGFVFESRGEGTNRGWPTSSTGDTVGCGIDFTTGQAFFTRNGELIGHAFSDMQNKEKLFPAVGLRTPRERVQINLSGPFIYDIDSHVQRVKSRVQAEVAATPLLYSLEPQAVSSWLEQTEEVRKQEAEAQAKRQQEEEAATNPIVRTSSLRRSRRRDAEEQRKKAERSTQPQGLSCPLPREPVKDLESAIAPSILQYLEHSGYFKASSALGKALGERERNFTRKNGDDGANAAAPPAVGVEDTDESTFLKTLNLKVLNICDLVAKGQTRASFTMLYREHELFAEENADWPATMLLYWFVDLLRQTATNKGAASSRSDGAGDGGDEAIHVDDDDDSPVAAQADLDFARTHLRLSFASTSSSSRFSTLDLALHVGQYLDDYPNPSAVLRQRIRQALSLLAYPSITEAPGKLKAAALPDSPTELAEKLLKVMRNYYGINESSKLENAYKQTAQMMRCLGGDYGVGAAAYIDVGPVIDVQAE